MNSPAGRLAFSSDTHRLRLAGSAATGHACGTDTALGRVVEVFGAAHPHHAYLFANRRANRIKVLVHDGIGIWLAARRLNQGRFVWPASGVNRHQQLSTEQLNALVLGLPWQRLGHDGIITVV